MNAIIILLFLIFCALISPELAVNLVTLLIVLGIFSFIYWIFKMLILQLMKLEHDTLLYFAFLGWCLFWYFISVPVFFISVVGICIWYYKNQLK